MKLGIEVGNRERQQWQVLPHLDLVPYVGEPSNPMRPLLPTLGNFEVEQCLFNHPVKVGATDVAITLFSSETENMVRFIVSQDGRARASSMGPAFGEDKLGYSMTFWPCGADVRFSA